MNRLIEQNPREWRFSGTPVSRGVGIGRAVILDGSVAVPSVEQDIAAIDADREIDRFRTGFAATADELSALAATDVTGVFSVHLLILEDGFASSVEEAVRQDLISAKVAIRRVAHELAERQRSVADGHIREKYLDIYDVAERLIGALSGTSSAGSAASGAIYIVSDLTPSRLIELAGHHPQAIISEQGGWTSHTSILAREYKLPTVTGVREMHGRVRDGDIVIVDGHSGTVIANPLHATIEQIMHRPRAVQFTVTHDDETETETADGTPVTVRVNANLPAIYDRAHRAGACGIGLYRSEVLFDRKQTFPSEEEQFQAYLEIATHVGEAGVRIRTFDIGVDRLRDDPRGGQANPVLGLRAVRLSLSDPGYFRTQVRAILRASKDRNIQIVLPMISGAADALQLRGIIDEVQSELGDRAGSPKVGVMIETPSAVMTVDSLVDCADFLCLGTNDLVQYLLAVGRDDPTVADWYQTLHPAVLRSLKTVIDAGAAAGVPVAVCGEMAGSAYYVPLLLGLGARELSMNVNAVMQVRSAVTRIDIGSCQSLATDALKNSTAAETDGQLRAFYAECWPFILEAAS